MESRSTNRMMIFLIFILFAVAIFGIVRYIGFSQQLEDNPWQNYKADLLARAHSGVLDAQKTWSSHPVAHYRLVIDRTAADGQSTCHQDLEVSGENLVTTYQDTCIISSASWGPLAPGWKPPTPVFETTVSQLFATAARDTSEIYWSTQGTGCQFILLDAQFDSQLGYPTQLAYRVQSPPVQMGFPVRAEFFRDGEGTPVANCADIQLRDGPIIKAQLTPMQ